MLNGWLSQWLSVKNMNVDKTKIVEITHLVRCRGTTMNEHKLTALYIALTGGSEAMARSVLIHIDLWRHGNRSQFL